MPEGTKQKRANKIGRLFERLFTRLYSTEEVPGSGNGMWRKMDAENSTFLFSLKATDKQSFSITKADLKEVSEHARGPGGLGLDIIPALAIDFVEGEEPDSTDEIMVVIPMNDLVSLLKERPLAFKANKKEIKKAQARMPGLFRIAELEEDI